MSLPTLRALLQQDEFAITLMDDGTGVLLDQRNETLLTLNGSAALIVAGISEGASQDDIVTRVMQRFHIDGPTARTDVEAFLSKLSETLRVSR